MVVVYNIQEVNSSVIPEKLKRMPHLFARVLELPVPPDTNVEVHETPDSLIFETQQPGLVAKDMKVEVVEIVPGAVKVVIGGAELLTPGLDVDCWRFRLPPGTSVEATRVAYEDEVLVVTVPKLTVGSMEGMQGTDGVMLDHRDHSRVLQEPQVLNVGGALGDECAQARDDKQDNSISSSDRWWTLLVNKLLGFLFESFKYPVGFLITLTISFKQRVKPVQVAS